MIPRTPITRMSTHPYQRQQPCLPCRFPRDTILVIFCVVSAISSMSSCGAFVPPTAMKMIGRKHVGCMSNIREKSCKVSIATRRQSQQQQEQWKVHERFGSTTMLYASSRSFSYNEYDDDDEDDDDDDDDEYIDTDTLGDWRYFRRSLSLGLGEEEDSANNIVSSAATRVSVKDERINNKINKKSFSVKSVSKDNEDILRSQNKDLAEEYLTGVWAHETSTPEVGGLVLRMPLEVELFRNYRHSLMGRKLKKVLDSENVPREELEISTWYAVSKRIIEAEMSKIADMADDEGQIEATQLKEESSEMLALYLDNQESWQEVCLVLERNNGDSKTLVLNRPMAFQLTENLGQLVLNGVYHMHQKSKNAESQKNLVKFMSAFKRECAVYVGGPDQQGNPAVMIHGIKDLPGATEICPGTQIYKDGVEAAVQGILDGKYNPLEFRFFIGCHSYKESALDVAVHLGKYQPIACARSVALKQCISLPKPLWHEVAELCGGDLENLSSLELLKRDDLQFQVVDETDYDGDYDDDVDIDIEIEVEMDDDDEDDDEYY